MVAATALAVVYGLVDYFPYEAPAPSHAEAIAYATLARYAWSFVVAWVVIACHYGYGGEFYLKGMTTDNNNNNKNQVSCAICSSSF